MKDDAQITVNYIIMQLYDRMMYFTCDCRIPVLNSKWTESESARKV